MNKHLGPGNIRSAAQQKNHFRLLLLKINLRRETNVKKASLVHERNFFEWNDEINVNEEFRCRNKTVPNHYIFVAFNRRKPMENIGLLAEIRAQRSPEHKEGIHN